MRLLIYFAPLREIKLVDFHFAQRRKDFDSQIEIARRQLLRVWSVLQNAAGTETEHGASARWEKALVSFRKEAAELNRRIKAWNLKVPAAGFQRKLIDIEKEVQWVKNSSKP